jgi:membrane protease YdiL (CAAX protease family)
MVLMKADTKAAISKSSVSELLANSTLTALLPVLGILVAESLTVWIDPIAGIAVHGLVLIALLNGYLFGRTSAARDYYLALSLVPLLRLFSLSFPLRQVPQIYWYVLAGFPLLLAIGFAARSLRLSWSWMGFQGVRGWVIQVLFTLVGIPLSLAAYLILRPVPLEGFPAPAVFVAGALILTLFAAAPEELIFRGILLEAATRYLGRGGLLISSLLFACLYLGSLSPLFIIFMGAVGFLFGWWTQQTGSIWGAIGAHSFMNIGMILLWPAIFSL